MNSKQNQYISADSIELGGHKGDGKSATIHHGRPRVNDTDFLQWAYDPERKNGNYSSTAYAYSPSKAERKATKKLGLSSLGLKSHTRPRTSEGSRNERTSGDGGSGMNMHGLGIAPSHSGQDSNENLVQMAFHSNQDPNAILKTSTVEVKVYSRS